MMKNNKKLNIGISLRIVKAKNYEEKRDALSHDWPPLLEKINSNIIFIPNNLVNVENFLNDFNLDGIILSGGDNIGDDQERDKTENQILNFAIKNKIPLFGVCRGMQVINQYFGGSIIKNNNSSHVGIPHVVNLIHKNIMSILEINSLKVNSFHNNVITTSTLGKNIEPFAITNIDKTVEGFFHKNFPIVGVMWHPERNFNSDNQLIIEQIFSKKLFWNE